MPSKVDKRRMEIVNILQTDSIANVNELAKLFRVTSETIRNDLDHLAEEQGFVRIHGGIKLANNQMLDSQYQFSANKGIHIEDKKLICYRAIDLIADGDCIYVDGGTTVSYLLQYLNRRTNITFVTPSIGILVKYMTEGYDKVFNDKGHKMIFIGGSIDSEILTTFGPFFDKMIEDLYFDTMFLSFDGVDEVYGCTNADEIAYAVISKVKKQAKKTIAMADPSKFGVVKRFKTIDWHEVDYLVTNYEIKNHFMDTLKKYNVVYYKA